MNGDHGSPLQRNYGVCVLFAGASTEAGWGEGLLVAELFCSGIAVSDFNTSSSGGAGTVPPPQKTRHGFCAIVAVKALAFELTTFRFSVATFRLATRSLSFSRPSGVLNTATI